MSIGARDSSTTDPNIKLDDKIALCAPCTAGENAVAVSFGYDTAPLLTAGQTVKTTWSSADYAQVSFAYIEENV